MENKIFSENGYRHITELINKAVQDGSRTAVITGNWEIDTPVRIPSDFTLILDGCHLRLADGCYSNIFINEHHDTDIGKVSAGTDRNISIIGKNSPMLDGGNYNGLSEQTQLKDGRPPVWKNCFIIFTNVEGFNIENILCHNNRWWALCFVHCSKGHISDISFKSFDIWVDENGMEHHGLRLEKYMEILVKTADGIDFRQGCHDILVENITGFIEDDTVAMTGLNGNLENLFTVEGLTKDIYNITVKDISSASLCNNIRILNQGGNKMYNLLIDGVRDMSAASPYMERGGSTVRIGDLRAYGEVPASPETTFDITVKNIHSRACSTIVICEEIGNLVFENISAFDGSVLMDDKRKK